MRNNMKKYILFCLSAILFSLTSCHERNEFDEIYKGQDKIVINVITDSGVTLKSEDTSVEHRVDWIDIFIFDENNALQHYERCDKRSQPDYERGQFVTQKNRSAFEENKKYFVFLVANSEADFRNITSLGDLQRIIEIHEDLHLSGYGLSNNAPERFLMDGVAYTGDTEPELPMTMVLNDGDLIANTELKATLRRAAAKIILNVTQGNNVQFMDRLEIKDVNDNVVAAGNSVYSFYQLPTGSTVIAPLGGMASYVNNKQTTEDLSPNSKSFIWDFDANNNPKLTITGYAYANDWSSSELTKETSLLLNIPMYWDEDNDLQTNGKESARPNNWFKIPLSRESKFERNKCYLVNIKINAIGAESKSSAIELDNIEYTTVDWIDVQINVGDQNNGPQYLVLNKDVIEMYNTNIDLTSLTFSSSSDIKSIIIKDVYSQNDDGSFTQVTDNYSAYYINKFGEKTNLNSSVTSTIKCIPEANTLNGSIYIISPIKPATNQEINNQIIALGEAPQAPELPADAPQPPTEPDGKPTEPTPVTDPGEQPIEPDPYDYVPNNSWRYEYRYNPNLNTFQRRSWVSNSWENIDTPQEYTNALNIYNNYSKLKAEYEKYLEELAKYEQELANWKNSDEYKAYLAELDAYTNNPTLKEYKVRYELYLQRLEEYNAAKSAIEATASASENHYNTIRYIEFEVENMTGQTATFRVMQYPTIYITNVEGWYSYRDDFKSINSNVTTYINGSDPYYNACRWNNGNYTYANVTSDQTGYLFRSKFYNDNQGDIDYYFYRNGNRSSYEAGELTNPRMYFVRVTATSEEYTIGKPRLVDDDNKITNDVENGYTSSDASNSKLVSPAFMIASQLGATQSPGVNMSDKIAADKHCKEYVEVAENGTEYHDWRLPTASEIDIIIRLQNSSLAMDQVLSGQSYWSASGLRNTNVGSGTGRIRCVRDVN